MCVCVGVCVCAFVCWNLTFIYFIIFLFSPLRCCCCRIMSSASHRASSSQVLYHVAATVQKQPYIKFVSFVAATDGASVRVLVCAMFPVDVGNRNEHIISKEVQVVGCCARGAGRYKLSPPRDFKNNRAATVHAARTGAVQQRYNSTSSSKSGPCDSRCAFVFLWVCSAHQKIRYMQS